MRKLFNSALAAALCLVFAALAGCASVPAETPAASDTEPSGVVSSADEGTEAENEPESEPVVEIADERLIELSGDPADEFIAERNCYAEGEQVILYFQEGVRVKGDMIDIAEKAMADITEISGLSFEKNHEPYGGYALFLQSYGMEEFIDINENHEKINIYVLDLGDYIQQTIDNSVIADSSDFYFEETSYQTLYHELVHVAHLRNGGSLGSTLTEGYAECITYEALKKNKTAAWNMIQYIGNNDLFDESLVYAGEEGFEHIYDDRDYNYQYGFRFMTFLFEEYGDGIFVDILKDATAKGYEDAYSLGDTAEKEADCQMLRDIVKANTSEDVFERFGAWYPEGWKQVRADYEQYMDSIGLGW